MRLLVRAGLAAVAAVTFVATPAAASSNDPIGEPGGECDGVVDAGCYVSDPGPKGPYSCTGWVAGICILEWAP